jgi:integrase
MKLDSKTIVNPDLNGRSDAIFFDDELPGFGLRVRASGRKVWIAQYRNRAGNTRRYTLGAVEKLTPANARRAAKKLLGAVAVGQDPQSEKVQARLVDSLLSVANEYLAARKRELRPASYKVTALYLTNPKYFGSLHSTPITAIGHVDVARALNAIKHDRPVTARQARTALSSLFVWAAGEGLMGNAPANPTMLTNVPAAPEPRDRVLSDAELVAIWHSLKNDDFGHIMRLLILLGNRRGEVGGMRWSELNLEAGAWLLPAARAKNGREVLIPLAPAALEIINKVERQDGRDCLFGGHAGRGFTAWTKHKHALDARLGEAVAEWRLHDARRSVATKMGDLGVQPHVIESALNHRGGAKRGVAGTYNRSPYEREVAAALALWAEHVSALVEDRESKVVALRA